MAREGIVSSKGHHKRTRLYLGIKGPRPDNKAHRVSEAKERLEAWQQLGLKGQLAALDSRLGKGVGAKAQRSRIQNLIDNPPKPTKKAKAEEAGLKPGELVVIGAETGTGERLKAKDRKASERAKRPGSDGRKA
jgi:hypothetical protein